MKEKLKKILVFLIPIIILSTILFAFLSVKKTFLTGSNPITAPMASAHTAIIKSFKISLRVLTKIKNIPPNYRQSQSKKSYMFPFHFLLYILNPKDCNNQKNYMLFYS